MLLNILTLSKTFTININTSSAILDLKHKIHLQEGIICEDQQLRDCTDYLDDDTYERN